MSTKATGAALRRRLGLAGLLAAPAAWIGAAYLGSLAVLLASAFRTTNPFTSQPAPGFSLATLRQVLGDPVTWTVTGRTLAVALAVTAIDAVLAVPLAYGIARAVPPRWRTVLLAAAAAPLWASYLVKAYAWRVMLGRGGLVDGALGLLGLDGPGYGTTAVVLVLAHLWLPYMILPIHSALERIPAGVPEAAADLGAGPRRAFTSVELPLLRAGLAAGSVFTFSLSLGDYLAVQIVGGKTQLIGTAVAARTTLDLPGAAALSIIPVLLVAGYIAASRRASEVRT